MNKEKVYTVLNDLSIPFEIIPHEPAYTVEDMEKVLPLIDAQVCKNLFLRDQKGKQHYLVIMPKEKPFNMKSFEAAQNLGKLSFASEERLMKYLAVPSGSVSPFGLINDTTGHVIVYVDQDLKSCEKVGVHPNTNDITVTLALTDLDKFLKSLPHTIYWTTL